MQYSYWGLLSRKTATPFISAKRLSLGSGALLDSGISPLKGKGNDKQSLLRSMFRRLNRGDILRGDAYYATYFLYCSLLKMGVAGGYRT